MITRRKLLIALGAGVVWGPVKAVAQQAASVPIVGILSLGVEDRIASFREGLRKLGYVEGRDIRLEERTAGDRYERLVEIANEFVRNKVDVIVAMGYSATEIAKKVTSTIPIVMVAGIDPVKAAFAASLSRPGGNVTGLSTMGQDVIPKLLELAKEAVPGLNRLGIVRNPDSRSSTASSDHAQAAAKTLNLQLQVVEVRSSAEFDKAFEALAKTRTKVFVVIANSMFAANWKQLVEAAAKYRLGGVFTSVDWAERGALFAYGPSYSEPYRRAAYYVDRILKGAKPGDLPIEQPTKFELFVNLKTAKALGIAIPPSILVRADRVIE